VRLTDSIRLFAKSRRADTPASSLERDQIGPHPPSQGFDAKTHGGGLGEIFDGDDLVVDEWFEGGAKDLCLAVRPQDSLGLRLTSSPAAFECVERRLAGKPAELVALSVRPEATSRRPRSAPSPRRPSPRAQAALSTPIPLAHEGAFA